MDKVIELDNGTEVLIPTLYKIVVKVNEQPKESKGGIAFTQEAIQKFTLLTNEGTIVAIGPKAFEYFKDDPEYKDKMPVIGDRATFIDYAGVGFEKDKAFHRIMTDEDVIGIIKQKDKIGA